MPAIVTNKFRIHNAKQFVEAFDEVSATSGDAVADPTGLLTTNMYLFIGKVTPWADDTQPPTPTDSVSNTVYNHWRDMIAAKRIGSADVSHVVPRYNWTSGQNYFAYTHANNTLFDQTFYTITADYNVYKCLANNNAGGTSTTEPSGTGTSFITTGDAYKWKFMYQVSASRALKFVTPSYMPTQRVRKANLAVANTTDSSQQYDVEVAANTSGNGAVEIAHVTTGGTNYKFETGAVQSGYVETGTTAKIVGSGLATDDLVDSDIFFTSDGGSGSTGLGGRITAYNAGTQVVTWTPALAGAVVPADADGYSVGPAITITGDGHGANVRTTNTVSGVIGDVVVVAGGNNYGNAVATLSSNGGAGGAIDPIIGPRGGHGDDAIEELGGFFVMVNSRLEYGESGNFTTNNDFRKIGLLAQPNYANGDVSTATIIDQAVTFTIQTWNSTAFAEDELVTGSLSGAQGKVIDFKGNTTIRLVDVTMGSSTTSGFDGITGSFRANETITAPSGAQANTSAVVGGDLEKFSGDVLYIENRSPVTRADDQIEDVKLIIEF